MVGVYVHDKKMATNHIINQKVLKLRTRRNAISMTGQSLAFIVELVYAIFFYLTNTNEVYGVMIYANMPIIVNFVWAIITVVQIWKSPEIRRFLNQKSNVVQPVNPMELLETFKLN